MQQIKSFSDAEVTKIPADGIKPPYIRKCHASINKRNRELAAYTILQDTNICPKILQVTDLTVEYEFIPTNKEIPINAESAGQLLGYIHNSSTIFISRNDLPSIPIFVKSQKWTQYLLDKINECCTRFSILTDRHQFLERARLDLLERVYQLPTEPTCLVHGDFTSDNILIDCKSTKYYSIDFGACLIGDPRFDLGKILFLSDARCHNSSIEPVDALLKGWEESSKLNCSDIQLEFYKSLHAILAINWFLKTNPATDIPTSGDSYCASAVAYLKSRI